MALVGFDDGPLAEVAEPPLTTVHQPMEQIGREMATMLLEQIGSGDGRVDQQLVLDMELVQRASG